MVDLILDSQSISITPHPYTAVIGDVETISASITNRGPLDAREINVSFYMSQRVGGDSPDPHDNGSIEGSYSGVLIGWSTLDINADRVDFDASGEVSIVWDTSTTLGETDIWVVVDYPAPGRFSEYDDISNNKARYWQGGFYVVEHKDFHIYGEILEENGDPLELNIALTNKRTHETLLITSDSSGFEASIPYPIWAQDGDILEVGFNHQNEAHRFEFTPDFKKSSYKISISVESEPENEKIPSFQHVFLIQILGIIVALAGLIAIGRRKKR